MYGVSGIIICSYINFYHCSDHLLQDAGTCSLMKIQTELKEQVSLFCQVFLWQWTAKTITCCCETVILKGS